jgi:tRNA (guanine37-N1)-methyltransferase
VQVEVITLFPEMVEQGLGYGVPRIAREKGALALHARNPRDYADNRHRSVDDRPFGGGPGMVMQAPPVVAAIEASRAALPGTRVVAMSPQGERLDQDWLQALAGLPALTLVCGRYEGLDERIQAAVDCELSLGDFVMSGGELAAMSVIDGIARLLPGVLGHEDSARDESFVEDLLDYPHYTRPKSWRGRSVPEVLLSGDHARIARWRFQQALGNTWLKRPDILESISLSEESKALLGEFIAQQQERVRKEKA